MSRITNDIIKSLRKSLQANDRKTSAYDTQATIRRIEGNTAWVHIPGGVDETPVQLTINASEGDTVQVRVSGGRAFLVGNASAPPTDNAYAKQVNRTLTQEIQTTNTVVKGVQKVVQAVKKIADNTNQYFWHTETGTDTGAHITEIPQEDFLADPENGGGNLLARSNGIAVRDGLTELSKFTASGVYLGEDDEVTISPISGASKDVWDNDNIGSYALPVSLDLSESSLYSNIVDGTEFRFLILSGSINRLSLPLVKGTSRTVSSGGWDINYDGEFSISVANTSLTSTYDISIAVSYTRQGGVFSFGHRNSSAVQGFFSSTFGEGLIASGETQAVFGQYNEDDPDKIIIVGNGAANSNGTITRLNAATIDQNGNIDVSGTYQKDGLDFITSETFDLGAISITSGTPGTASTTITKTIEKTGYRPICVKIRYVQASIIGFNAFFTGTVASGDIESILVVQVIRRQSGAASPGYHAYADVTYIKS